MADRTNFIIGYGERLVSDLAAPVAGGPKAHPYTFADARKRLAPRLKATAEQIAELPTAVCPRDEAVALVTLHPTYLAKSYYPGELLRAYALETIGSRPRRVSPDKWARKKPPESAVTSELFVAGKRSHFRQLAADIGQNRATPSTADDLIRSRTSARSRRRKSSSRSGPTRRSLCWKSYCTRTLAPRTLLSSRVSRRI